MKNKMSKILVTGGGGYIGSILVKELVDKGYGVKVFDKFYFGKEPLKNLEKRIEIEQGDIRNFDKRTLKDVDAIVHLAGLSNDPMAQYNPEANIKINAEGTRNLAKACAEEGINRFTYASSASIYDKGLQDNDADELKNEETKVSPRAPYSVSKYEGEKALLKIMKEYPNFSPIILRQGTVYGHSPRMRFDLVVNTFTKEAFRTGKLNVFCGGSQWRPLIDVKDVARAHIACIQAREDKVKGEVFNLIHDNYRVLDIAHRVKNVLRGVKEVSIDVDYEQNRMDRSYRISGKKIEEKIGFKPKVSIEESVEEIVEKIQNKEFLDFNNPIYYNIKWIELLSDMEKRIKEIGGSVF